MRRLKARVLIGASALLGCAASTGTSRDHGRSLLLGLAEVLALGYKLLEFLKSH